MTAILAHVCCWCWLYGIVCAEEWLESMSANPLCNQTKALQQFLPMSVAGAGCMEDVLKHDWDLCLHQQRLKDTA